MDINEDIRGILNKIRTLEENVEPQNGLLKESDEKGRSKSIAITDDPKFGQNVLTNQIQQFRTSVESGAQFSKVSENVSECPLIYMPSTGNLIFSGVIPCLNNLKFQFVLKTSTGNGCFLWADGLILNRDNLQILSKLQGFYKNWVEEWIQESSDLEQMAAHWQE